MINEHIQGGLVDSHNQPLSFNVHKKKHKTLTWAQLKNDSFVKDKQLIKIQSKWLPKFEREREREIGWWIDPLDSQFKDTFITEPVSSSFFCFCEPK
jgi:hypothetical protein